MERADREVYLEKREARNFEAITALQDQVTLLNCQRKALQIEVDTTESATVTAKD